MRGWQSSVWLGVAIGAASPPASVARAEVAGTAVAAQPGEGAGLARVRMPGVGIPVNGAILIEGAGLRALEVEVLDGDGALVPGALTRVGEVDAERTLYAFLPEQPFQPGAYAITVFDPFDSSLAQLDELQMVDAIDDALPVLMSAPSASELTGGFERACCEAPDENLAVECAIVQQTTVIRVDGGLWSTESAAKLNQYVFRYSPRTGIGTASVRPRPLETLEPINFVNDADEYCFELTALNVATQEERVYTDLPSCAARGELFLGTVDVEPPPAFFSPERCPFPPPALEAQWCETNQDVCEAGVTEHCEQYEHICNGGPLPERWSPSAPAELPTAGAGRAPRIDLSARRDAGDEAASEREDSGCSATAIAATPTRALLAWLALALTALRLRYAARRHETLRSFPPRRESHELQDARAQARARTRRLRRREDPTLER